MKIRIELEDIPEFKNNLDILITLKKDGEGVVSTKVTTPSSSPRDFSRSTNGDDNTSMLTVDGVSSVVEETKEISAKVVTPLSSPKPSEKSESTKKESKSKASKTKKTDDSKPKLSGNMMGINF